MAARADGGRTHARSYGHFDALLVGTEMGLLVDKASETMAAVENRDQFHGADESSGETTTINRLYTRARRLVSTRCDHAESRGIGKPLGDQGGAIPGHNARIQHFGMGTTNPEFTARQ